MKFKIDKRWITAGKWLLFAGLFYLAITHIDFDKLLKSLTAYSPWTLFFFVALHYLSRGMYSVRMHMMCIYGLGFRGINPLFLLRINLLGEFMEVAFPTVFGGDAVRMLKLADQTKRYGLSAAGVLVDRAMGAFVTFLIGIILFPNLGGSIAKLLEVPWEMILTITGIVTVIIIIAVIFVVRGKLHEPFLKAIRTFKWNVNSVFHPFVIAVVGNLIFAASYIPLYADLEALDLVNPWAVMALIFFGQMVMIIPISLAGVSIQEGAILGISMYFGMSQEAALSIVLISLATRYFLAASGLAVELIHDGRRVFNSLKSDEMAEAVKKAEDAIGESDS